MEFDGFRRWCWFCYIIFLTLFVRGHKTEFVYSKNGFNISNAIQMGRSLEGYILGIIPYISFEKCIEECLSRRRCLSLNYKQQFPICELNYETKSTGSGKTFTVSKGAAYTEMTKWKKSMLNKCNPDLCKTRNERCFSSERGQYCQISDCGPLRIPKLNCTEMDKSQGISIHSKVTYRCQEGFKLIGRSSITCQPNGQWSEPRFECKAEAFDCHDLKKQGLNQTGVYRIAPLCPSKLVRCDMEEGGGGWTVLSRRIDNTRSFNRSWHKYKNGFGNSSRNYWIGNYYIHALTKDRPIDLLFILESKTNGEKHKFMYKNFKVGNEANNFKMTFDFYPEYLDDDFKDKLPYKQLCNEHYPKTCHNNTKFSTYDKDNTGNETCPQIYGGGWWYNRCHHVSLTGDRNVGVGYRWRHLKGLNDEGLLQTSVMMIRPSE